MKAYIFVSWWRLRNEAPAQPTKISRNETTINEKPGSAAQIKS
jgi:hypothetical protein